MSLFSGELHPLKIRFLLTHWLEIVALGDGQDSEMAVRDLREALKFEYEHLKPGRLPCRCGDLEFPKATLGGGGMGGRSFSDIVPSIETAYEALPLGWQGRTKVWLMLEGYTEEEIYRMRERPERRAESPFDKAHVERVRQELRRPGFRPRVQDQDAETESPWRRMASALGWSPAQVIEFPVEALERAA